MKLVKARKLDTVLICYPLAHFGGGGELKRAGLENQNFLSWHGGGNGILMRGNVKTPIEPLQAHLVFRISNGRSANTQVLPTT